MQRVAPNFTGVVTEANNPSRLDASTRSKINRELSKLPNYHEGIPLDLIENILEKYGLDHKAKVFELHFLFKNA